MDQKLKDLNLILLFLCSWTEEAPNNRGKKLFYSWVLYPFVVLEYLHEKKFIAYSKTSKSVVFTQKGVEMAERLDSIYLKTAGNLPDEPFIGCKEFKTYHPRIFDLSLLLLYLCRWEQTSRVVPGKRFFSSSVSFLFEVMEDLKTAELIYTTRKKKKVILSNRAVNQAKVLMIKHGIDD